MNLGNMEHLHLKPQKIATRFKKNVINIDQNRFPIVSFRIQALKDHIKVESIMSKMVVTKQVELIKKHLQGKDEIKHDSDTHTRTVILDNGSLSFTNVLPDKVVWPFCTATISTRDETKTIGPIRAIYLSSDNLQQNRVVIFYRENKRTQKIIFPPTI